MLIGLIIMGIVFSFAGIALIVISIFAKQKPEAYFNNALQAEGVIIDLGISQPRPFKMRRFSEPAYTSVVVEFKTQNGETVQTEMERTLAFFYSGQYKKGDKVSLLYNPVNPEEIVGKTSQSTKAARLIMLSVGFLLILTGLSMILIKNFYAISTNR